MTAKYEKRYSAGFVVSGGIHIWPRAGRYRNDSERLYRFHTPDARDYGSGYSSAAWDIRHNFTSSFVFDLPIRARQEVRLEYEQWRECRSRQLAA